MVHRATLVWTVAALGALVGSTLSAYASSPPTVSVGGEVQFPTSYTPALLAALPQTTATVTVAGRQYTDTGVLLETLVSDAGPAFPSSITNLKNRVLRVTATVRGSGREVTFAVGELDPSFGNHQALLALTQNGAPIDGGPQLVVPGDRNPARFVPSVSQVEVGIATAPATNTQPVAASPVTLHTNGRQVSLTPALRAHLASETLTVSFGGPTGEQTHTEIGPPLINVLALAGAGAGEPLIPGQPPSATTTTWRW